MTSQSKFNSVLLNTTAGLAKLLIPGLMFVVAGCGSLSTSPQPPLAAFADNNAIQHWQLRGKIGFRNSEQANSAYLNWLQCGDAFDIRLSGPMGQLAAHLFGNSQQVTLATADQAPLTADSAEQLMNQQLGWALPVSQLVYWVRGIPDPDQLFSSAPPGFQQAGWQLSYPKQTRAEPFALPAKAVASHPRLTVTLILKNWNLQPDCGPTGNVPQP